jgi:hypothetical protein
MQILSSWPNEAKNSCVLRLLVGQTRSAARCAGCRISRVAEAPHRREPWLDLAEFFHAEGNWVDLLWACTNGIERTRRTGSYLDDPAAWGYRLIWRRWLARI